jgi:hypothetical protein
MKNGNGSHYHIHWSGKPTLDWERFDTTADAEANARKLMLPGETYTIEEHGESCPRCLKFMKNVPVLDNEASA